MAEIEINSFTPEGIALATFKMTLQNNAMLRSIIRTQATMMADLTQLCSKYGPYDTEVMSETINEYETLLQMHAAASEELSLKTAWDFAVEHDTNLDFDIKP